jgi:hypothetical protein
MATPTSRTLQLLRAEGWTAAVAESWVPRVNVRRDLFAAFDVVAIRPDRPGVLGVQTTSGTNHAGRRSKLLGNPAVRTWLQAGNAAEVWSWHLIRGKWACRREALTLTTEGPTAEARTPGPSPRRARRGERQPGLFDGEAGRLG